MSDLYPFPNARLLIFAKAPVPGQVKTRLAGRLGACGAANLYKKLLRRTLALAVSARLCPVELWCAPETRHGFFAICRREYGVRLRRQGAGDLGQRMHHALSRALAEGHHAVLLGGDCISLGAAELGEALRQLAAGPEAVLGPASDGGYVLVGLRRPCSRMFQGIVWGTATVMAATHRRLHRTGMQWAELPMGWDVDVPADLRRLRRTQAEEAVSCASPKDSVV
ncbi:MAG: TIGR04282 family arsenosugar biosynthesis glycosyltransferase [Gammaproteobacteria bacterium]|nr:TIGR04282 family arsenosugar biosynthesis glycosyltransferase [Gammaproteobacteria bacterium]MCP5198318.1 TIGR04282 family arsenosugar biosynthesis glycosyltransferase [Gammaproteobacteria bacterium]